MSRDWSKQIGRCYSLSLSDDLVEWFDQELWRESLAGDFRYPLRPDELLEPSRDWLWPGFMSPDILPIIGNDRGDWLCLRFNTSDSVAEVIQWYHGGGDWTPYGETLADALSLDATNPTDLTRHAHPPDLFEADADAGERSNSSSIDDWIARHSSKLTDPSTFACRRTAIDALRSQVKSMCDATTADKASITWEPDFVRSLFDSRELDDQVRKWLVDRADERPLEELTQQDWAQAEQAAVTVIQQRSDLGWAFTVAGWGAERRGDLTTAIDRYAKGIHATAFTDEAIALRSHWFKESFGKFCCARLFALNNDPESVEDREYLSLFCVDDAESLRSRVRDYWLQQAELANKTADPARAYHCYFQAGWDMGLQFLSSYRDVYGGLVESAAAAGWQSLANLARIHHEMLDR